MVFDVVEGHIPNRRSVDHVVRVKVDSDPERRAEGAESGGVYSDGSIGVVKTPNCAADSVNLGNNYRSPDPALEVGNVQIIA